MPAPMPRRLCTALFCVANITALPVVGQRRTPDETQRAAAAASLAPDLDDTLEPCGSPALMHYAVC